ncbi:late competence development ComFB family protein [Alkaliphilus sp. MSJ-5]|uniref:Late competence development ComFB family protein n=2 Tax=Alkaliphilus flagellatus TaxID=2841507 RepID=A0ABS6G5B9_9FIRM|nr:late competence development ComFB family protein [Alkaliphilus flagellatus]
MEDVVDLVLKRILMEDKYGNQCVCEQCTNDIKAIALNNLKPRYIATEKGSVLSKANMFTVQSEIDVTKVLVEAMEKVNKLPKHRVME